jgi:uncharacterized protein (DUF2141 family)
MRRLATITILTLLLGVPSTAGADDEPADIVLDVTGLEDDSGVVRCALHTKSDWLNTEDARRRIEASPDSGEATCRFEDVEAGTYAVAAYHDRDDDGEMDSNFLGIPSEPVCASNNPEANMGPPSFSDAKFRHGDDETEVPCTM